MIGWGDVYKVVVAMAPLYFALALGYGSVRWWKLFTPDQCGAINRLVIYFAYPFFGFDLAARAGTFAASYRVLAADVDKFIMCGARLTALSLVLRFVAGPAAATVGAVVLGLRGDLLRFAIVQAALPQSVATFNFAREYDLHADILSTAIIVGTLVSLPVLIAYYTVLGLIR
ncbi:hypothetical protein PR202_gn00413 [Eleusine coracana subsp. coracana]|uniref:Auxin efflux carrier component n=1 Tax=Eleusine coracana subsp. coracana TaxID=191504 RepID=A0AAV5G1M5_ELECO|nr:hypothetical protein PR202_gn00413 [Eleusine coracana subsp. coracana]